MPGVHDHLGEVAQWILQMVLLRGGCVLEGLESLARCRPLGLLRLLCGNFWFSRQGC